MTQCERQPPATVLFFSQLTARGCALRRRDFFELAVAPVAANLTRPDMSSPRLLVALGFALAWAHAQTALPSGEPLLAGSPLAAFQLNPMPGHADAVAFALVDASGPGFTRAWRIETRRDTSPMAAIELRALNANALARGDVVMVRFFARTIAASDETGHGRVQLVVRRNGVDFNSSLETAVSFGRAWQEFLLPFPAGRDFAPQECAFMFRFGFMRQTVEIGGLEVIDYGKTRPLAALPNTRFSYAGRAADARWRTAALERIERIRQDDFVVRVTDAAGTPLRGATVRVEQQRAAFEFGTCLQFARLVHDSPENQRYRRKALELFNAASPENDWKWVTLAGDWGRAFNLEQSLAGLRWLREHQLAARGHVLVWPGWKNLPHFVHDLRGTPREKEIPGIVLDHVREVSRRTRDLVGEWDVLNEPFTNHDLMDIFGREIMPDWFKVAHAEMPGAKLFFNDFSNHDATTDADHVAHFEETTQFLLDRGAPVDGLGLQAHISNNPNAPENILAVLDRYQAKFHLPVRITEFDVWTEDEELQADYTRDFFIACFSHPSVVGLQVWGFWERAHWRPSAAMYRTDWSEKPNGRIYRELVLDRWRTRVKGSTDATGRFAARGFHGDYVAIVEVSGQRVERTFRVSPGRSTALEVKVE